MKMTIIGAFIGLIIGISWAAWGFLTTLAILGAIIIFAAIGLILDICGFSMKKLVTNLSTKLAN